jgi:formylglycine-generating enzyme required for sulfatase activity
MAIAVTCNACHTELLVRDEFLNKEVQCPVCQATLAASGEHVSDHEVFISYSNKDQTVANAVCATLEAQSIRCWIAPRDIPPGAAWGGSIIKAIEDARIMVLIYSGSANLSPQVIREVERAVSKGLVLVPLRIDDARMSKEMEYFLSRSHWLDALTPPLENHLAKLAETCRLLLLQDPQEMSFGPVSVRPARRPITKLKVPERSGPPPKLAPNRSNTGTLVTGMAIVALAFGLAVWQPWKNPVVPAGVGRVPPRGETSTPIPPAVGSGPTTTVVVATTTGTTAVVETATNIAQPATNIEPAKLSPPSQVTATIISTGASARKEMAIDLGGGVKMEFVLIPAGSFMMGSSDIYRDRKPVHKVTIGKAFYLGKYEVTQEQWEKVMGNNPSEFKGTKNPVERVNWNKCQEFVVRLSNTVQGRTFRLPTEAEWEYACRAGSTTDYCFGDDPGKLGGYAWFKDNSGEGPHIAGQKRPNAWGLYDMHGNVNEWCEDFYCHTYEGAPADGSARKLGDDSRRVLRGGTWNSVAARLQTTQRVFGNPDILAPNCGLRVVAEVVTP